MKTTNIDPNSSLQSIILNPPQHNTLIIIRTTPRIFWKPNEINDDMRELLKKSKEETESIRE